MVKQGIRKFAAACPGSKWWEFLPDIARAIRLVPMKATGYSPFVLVYKQVPKLPFPSALGQFEERDIATLTER